jgi:hypothetical protein
MHRARPTRATQEERMQFPAGRVALAVSIGCLSLALLAWTPLPVKSDRNLFMPGSQQGSVNLESANRCDNCHGGYNTAIEPAHNWRGSMMANAARDPLWLATLAVALQDSIWATGNTNAGDLCIRCHSTSGWLGGRSEPTNTSALSGSDFEGVSCDFCHRMVDPIHALRQNRDLAQDSGTAGSEADKTYARDFSFLSTLTLFSGSPFLSSSTRLPAYYGIGALPDYIEATTGQYFVDTDGAKRGPRADAAPKHQWYYSRYHKTKYFCATCHDVSNPVLANLASPGLPERQAGASYYHVERTFSEFMLSAYGRGGATVDSKIGSFTADKCQDCHMRDVTGASANKSGILTRTDLALHDMTGGNTWMSRLLGSADSSGPAYDPYNYAILSGKKYSGAKIDVSGLQGYGRALLDAEQRALQQLQMAATLVPVADGSTEIVLRVQNNSGHKLISGFPEGRRMWLNVKFFDMSGSVLGEVNPYQPLVITRDAAGNAQYVSGATLTRNRDDLVWEAMMSSSLTGESKSLHFVLATDRQKDNRIPPRGFDIAAAATRFAQPRWNSMDAAGYFSAAEYEGGYDQVAVSKPADTYRWEATLYYQTTSREYVEFLKNEINATGTLTLGSPTPSGETQAYIAQSDPFFASLKGWGSAMYDLWLHNGGAAPVPMTTLSGGAAPPPPACDAPAAPATLSATGGKRRVTLSWSASTGAASYRIYYAQNGKYTYRTATTSTSYTDTGLTPDQTYCYAVTAVASCGSESSYSPTACAVVTRN